MDAFTIVTTIMNMAAEAETARTMAIVEQTMGDLGSQEATMVSMSIMGRKSKALLLALDRRRGGP